jgi:hypothetical protein
MKDGGPAFPLQTRIPSGTGGVVDTERYEQMSAIRGMSLRDYFAAAALQGIIACPTAHRVKDTGVEVNTMDQAAEIAYQYADAMLLEREKQP